MQCRRPRFDPWVEKIPWRSKWWTTPVSLPGISHGLPGLQSMGSQKVGHDWATNTYLLSPKSKGVSLMWDTPPRVSLHGLPVTGDFGEWAGLEAMSPKGELAAAISMGDRTGVRMRQGWAEASSGLNGDWWPVGDRTGAGDILLSWPHFPQCLWWLMAISPSVGISAKQERLERDGLGWGGPAGWLEHRAVPVSCPMDLRAVTCAHALAKWSLGSLHPLVKPHKVLNESRGLIFQGPVLRPGVPNMGLIPLDL